MLLSDFAKPRNERICETFLGVGNSVIALYLLTYGLIPA